MKERGDSENATLEFKSSRLLDQKNDKVFETLSKEITAFANSIGGVFIIGIEEDDDRGISKVVPITNEKNMNHGLKMVFSPASRRVCNFQLLGSK